MLERYDRMEEKQDEWISDLRGHIKGEDDFKVEMTDRFKAGDERMANIEREISTLNQLVAAFDGFKRSLNIIAALSLAVLSIFLWILNEKNSDIKATQETLMKHSVALEKTIASHQELEKDTRKDFDRVESALTKIETKLK
jgi:hypothetical protein